MELANGSESRETFQRVGSTHRLDVCCVSDGGDRLAEIASQLAGFEVEATQEVGQVDVKSHGEEEHSQGGDAGVGRVARGTGSDLVVFFLQIGQGTCQRRLGGGDFAFVTI